MRVFLATKNPGKRAEFQRLLGPSFELLTGDFPPVVEGAGMVANAIKKAKAGYSFSGLPSLGEDSGLFINALAGSPGPFSSRYGGANQDRIKRVLTELRGVKDRSAYFLSIIALVINDNLIKIFAGRCFGQISTSPQGSSGFGYDPIFIPIGYRDTFAVLGPQVKDRISHRARAIQRLKEYLIHRGVAQPG